MIRRTRPWWVNERGHIMSNSFSNVYKSNKCYWGLEPTNEVVSILKYVESGDVLDLGVGQGRNALFLAKYGFDVTGVDIAGEGIKKFLDLARVMQVNVTGIVSNIMEYIINRSFDVVISNATLHFLEKEEIDWAIEHVKNHTNPNGLNVITVFTIDNPNPNFPHLFEKNELKQYYSDWEILEYGEYVTPMETHGENGIPHQHGVAGIIARSAKEP
jgi:tellurite methyltransferase